MAISNNSRLHQLFDDEPQLEISDALEVDTEDEHGFTIAAAAIASLIVLTLVVWVFASWHFVSTRADKSNQLQVSGARIGQLQSDALVVLGGVEVGRVERISLEAGVPVANISLGTGITDAIPGDSTFVVKPLNRKVPGNLGIEIIAGEARDVPLPARVELTDEGDSMFPSLSRIQDLFFEDDGLSSVSHEGHSTLATVAILACAAIAIGVMRRLAKATLTLLFIIVVVAVVVALAMQPDLVNLEELQEYFGAATQWLHRPAA